MKRRSNFITMLVIVAILVASYFIYLAKIGDKIVTELNTRYPEDTFSIEDSSLSLIPFGVSARAKTRNSGIEFDVSYVVKFGADENEIRDNMYEMKTKAYYQQKLADFVTLHQDWIEGETIEPVVTGEANINPDRGVYTAKVNFLLAKEIETSEEMINSINYLLQELAKNPVEGVDCYRFISFPGSITERNAKTIGLDVNKLTAPTYPPTSETTVQSPAASDKTKPSGQSNSAASSESAGSAASSVQSEAGDPSNTTAKNEKATTTLAAAKESSTNAVKARPVYVLEFNALTKGFTIDADLIKNGIRERAVSKKELNQLADDFQLDANAKEKLEAADKRQTRDVWLEQYVSEKKAKKEPYTTPETTKFAPSLASLAADKTETKGKSAN